LFLSPHPTQPANGDGGVTSQQIWSALGPCMIAGFSRNGKDEAQGPCPSPRILAGQYCSLRRPLRPVLTSASMKLRSINKHSSTSPFPRMYHQLEPYPCCAPKRGGSQWGNVAKTV
jgi:hypothetical protein